MIIKQPISTKELQDKLYKMGASARLLKMPAVIERLKQDFLYFNNVDLDIGTNGEIITPNGVFSEKGESEAEFKSDELKIEIDSFGIEKSAEVKSTKSKTYRANNKIIYEEPFDGEYFGPYHFEYPDNAAPILDDVFEYATSFQENLLAKTSLEDNKKYLLNNFPQTKGWFNEKGFLIDEKTSEETSKMSDSDEEKSITFSPEVSENNRILFYYNQIKSYKKNEEDEDKKIEIIRKFAKAKSNSTSSTKNDLSDEIDLLIDSNREQNGKQENVSDSIDSTPKSLIEKARKTLDYMKTSASSKIQLRKQIEKAVINKLGSVSENMSRDDIEKELEDFIKRYSSQDLQHPTSVEEDIEK